MSGGFFRGTSADQDTRFSNKQAKLLKTQKFASELDHLVDMTKVKMDVMKPWIATRVTELLGFEDEVLINFIYGLLEGKEVNGKEVQISLTGFMEKHTAKFMKELWTLLLSAQKNASGVPQQFLDAKEEEARKKKLEADRIANEIQKKKEKESRELDKERSRNMDGAVEMKTTNAASVLDSKTMLEKDSSSYPKDKKEAGEKNGVRGRSSDRRKSRSVSRSPKARRRSISPRRQSITPRRRHSPRRSRSPSRRLSYFRRRSRSHSPRRSPSPVRRRLRSPFRGKSPMPLRRRSPSPVQHRRSPSPVRRRGSPSPIRRRRSPSPSRRRRSPPIRRRRSPSPIRRRRSPSPLHHRSPSPTRRISPSPVQRRYQRSPLASHRSPSPIGYRAPMPSHLRSPTPSQRRSPSPYESSSSSPVRRRHPSPVRRTSLYDGRRSTHTHREKYGTYEKLSPVACRPSSSLRSPQQDLKDRKDLRKRESAFSPSPERSPTVSESPPRLTRKRSTSEDRSFSPDESPVRQTRERMVCDGNISPSPRPRERRHQDGTETSKEGKENNRARDDGDRKSVLPHERSVLSATVSRQRGSPVRIRCKKEHSPGSERLSGRGGRPETFEQQRSPALYEGSLSGDRQRSTYPGESKISEERNRSYRNNGKDSDGRSKTENATMEAGNVDKNNRSDSFDSGSEENGKHKTKIKDKRKHKKHGREEVASDGDNSYDSEIDKKDAKRRRKEEKKLRREEKRRRRDERRRRKEERRAAKLKMKNQSDADASDDEHAPRREYRPSDDEETESDQKRLEIELRNKALESIKAKRNSSH
ncbi:PWI domain-containing protein [Citrus sinensis]|uniref:PWI domain-containing protein n=1 Tax=Citrus sinensis TaxID=2711 RepID=A0ACB8IX20_CITSI|nr:PWI domain-containing protein [Citrus sinensis]